MSDSKEQNNFSINVTSFLQCSFNQSRHHHRSYNRTIKLLIVFFLPNRQNNKSASIFFHVSNSSANIANLGSIRDVCTNVDSTLIADQRNFKAKYLQNGEKN